MRRSAAALALTVIALWLILTFKSSPLSHAVTTAPPAVAAPAPSPGGTPPTTPPTTAGATRTVTGNVYSNRYGNVQVAIVLDGTRITDVEALQMPTDRARSADISSQAAPLLHDEVIQAQNAQIDTIGGATYTSASYAQSLQSALDKAHG
jgi:uncharacterized protein with FMN-binding domain